MEYQLDTYKTQKPFYISGRDELRLLDSTVLVEAFVPMNLGLYAPQT